MAQTMLIIITVFILFEFALSKVLGWLNLQTWDKPLPAEVADLYDKQKYEEAKQYAQANFKLGAISSTLSLVVSILFLWLGGFAWVDNFVHTVHPSPILQTLLFFGILMLGSSIISLPFEIYSTFVIEQKFGFNKMTPGLFVMDKVKNLLLGVILGGAILALLTWLFYLLGDKFWLAAWSVVSGFSLFMAMFYTSLLLPLFNKLTPLEAGELRSAIEKYASTIDFPLTNIFIMDGSKRSTKANAFFSGLGFKKNIVLYDNLVKDMSTEEVTAILAHEVGHYKRKHIVQSMIISVLQMGIMFFIFGWLSESTWMAEVLGAKKNNFHLSLVTFSLIYSPISMVTGLLFNLLSRKNEYEADDYAKQTYGAGPLITSLKKLSVSHLSNLQPHPAYVFVNYSHPTMLQRINAMEKA
jgi:STE24 endopeptidase